MNDLSTIIRELEQQQSAIDAALSALRGLQGSSTAAPAKRRGRPKGSTQAATGAKKRVLSAEGRKHIIEATKKRWAAKRAAEGAQQKTAAAKKTGRSLTPAGRKRLSDMMKARWASKNPPKPVKNA